MKLQLKLIQNKNIISLDVPSGLVYISGTIEVVGIFEDNSSGE